MTGDERAVVVGFLEFHRATFEAKCSGLAAGAAARRVIAPSTLSLLGLLRHAADTERAWFDRIAGRQRPFFYASADAPEAAFDTLTGTEAELAAAWADWRSAVDEARQVLDGADFDGEIRHPQQGAMNVRWVVVHMVEEYARHNGHADLLREVTDGVTGA